jgi:hypothetical protein
MTFRECALVLVCTFICSLTLGAQSAPPVYTVIDSVITGSARGDFYAVDREHRRLYGAGRAIVDIDRKAVVDSLSDSTRGGGFMMAYALDRGIIRDGIVFDLKTMRTLWRTEYQGDGSVYDPRSQRAFLFGPESTTVIDVKSPKLLTRISIPGAGESAAADDRGQIYVNIARSNEIVVLDAQTLRVRAHYSVAPGRQPMGLAMDVRHRRLFAACDSMLVVLNADNGLVVATIPTDGHSDQNAFDAGTQLVFMPSGPKGLTIAHEDTPNKYTVVQHLVDPRVTSIRVVVDEKTHRLFLPHTFEGDMFGFEILAINAADAIQGAR